MDISKIAEGVYVIAANTLLNAYALENIVTGKIHPKDCVPVDEYFNDLDIGQYKEEVLYNIGGTVIDDSAYIKDRAIVEFCMDFFSFNINSIFAEAPKYSDEFEIDTMLCDFDKDIMNYIDELFIIFCNIVINQIPSKTYLPFSDISIYNLDKYCKGLYILKKDICIDNYIKYNRISLDSVQNIVIEKNQLVYLRQTDSDSIEYKLYLLSMFKFQSKQNQEIYLSMIENWKKEHLLHN